MCPASSDAIEAAGRRAAERLYRDGRRAIGIRDPLHPRFAESALDELERLLTDMPGLLRDVIEGAGVGAESLNVHPEQGLVEVIQNADDCHASEVRLTLRRRGGRRRMLIAHDGDPVLLPDVVGMTFAFFSTKRDDARSKGRYGVGLKTLSQMAGTMQVHCGPYHFEIVDQRLRRLPAAGPVAGFWTPDSGDTLLILELRDDFDADGVRPWLDAWDASSMLFLDSVRRLAFLDARGRVDLEHRLELTPRPPLTLRLGPRESEIVRDELRDPASERRWTRYCAERAVPVRLRRAQKATGATSPVALAVPEHGWEAGKVFAGLPLLVESSLPFSVHGQLDPDTSRARLRTGAWNSWVVDGMVQLATAILAGRLADAPRSAWQAVPLEGERAGGDAVSRELLAPLNERVRERVTRTARVSGRCAFAGLSYEAEGLGGLVDAELLQRLAPERQPVEPRWRDRAGRWRVVLDDVARSTRVELPGVLATLRWPDLGRDVRWLRALVATALAAGLGDELLALPWIVLADGRRLSPEDVAAEGLLLVESIDGDDPTRDLGVAAQLDPGLLAGPDADALRAFARDRAGLVERPDPPALLRTFAARPLDVPLDVTDAQLLVLRDALASVGDERAVLGRRVGERVRVDGIVWARGAKRGQPVKVRPTEAYMPASIESQRDGFAQAAKRTPGLRWVDPRYERLLRSTGRRGEVLAARAVFAALGAETAPRLVRASEDEWLHSEHARPIGDALPVVQQRALDDLGRTVTHVRRDHLSPDLEAVVADIRAARVPERRERARILLLALNRAWERLYAERSTCDALHGYYTYQRVGVLPATWLAQAASAPWLTNERRAARAPYQLAVRTPAFLAAVGNDPARFAAGLDAADAELPIVHALRLEEQPRASTVVATLVALRDAELRGERIDVDQVHQCYRVLAGHCSPSSRRSRQVDDLSDADLRRSFARRGRQPGLIRVAGGWRGPGDVFRGRAIFGRHADVVPEFASELWQALSVPEPDISACVAVLREIAQSPPEPQDRPALIEIYHRIETLLASGARAPRSLASLPLWTGERWSSHRPMWAVGNPALEAALSGRLTVWCAPISPARLPRMVEALHVTVLGESAFTVGGITDRSMRAGGEYEPRFRHAIEHFEKLLAERDPEQYDRLAVGWSALEGARLAITPRLRVEIPIGGGDAISVPSAAHVDRGQLLASFSSAEAIGRDDQGGWAMATLFDGGDRDKVAFAWAAAWQRSEDAGPVVRVRLSDATGSDQIADLAEAARRPRSARVPPPPAPVPGVGAPAPAPPAPRSVVRRRLKDLTQIVVVDVAVVNPEAEPGRTRRARGRGLRARIPAPPAPSAQPAGAPRAYSDAEREAAGLRVLARALSQLDGRQLDDYRRLRGVGADALDELRRAVELKAYSGELPQSVVLSGNEAELAARQRDDYLLAVVSGLEEGFQTRVRLFADPLRTLDWVHGQDVELGGIHTQRGLDVLVEQAPAAQ